MKNKEVILINVFIINKVSTNKKTQITIHTFLSIEIFSTNYFSVKKCVL